jgi:hypothetical protein
MWEYGQGPSSAGSHLSRVLASYAFWSVLARLVRLQLLPRIWALGRKARAQSDEGTMLCFGAPCCARNALLTARFADLQKEALHRDKWMYDIWNFVVYACMNISNAWLWFSPWLWDGDSWGCYADQAPDPALEPTYAYVFGLYLHLLEWEILVWRKTEEASKRRIYVMHHLVVLGLMACSWMHGWLRWGIVLILWHDVADPPMALAKMGVHLWGDNNLWSDLWFSVFVAAFTIPRLLWYPYYILGQVYKCVDTRFISGGEPFYEASITEWAIVAMLHVLWACHWVWMSQIVRFALKKFLPPKTQSTSNATITTAPTTPTTPKSSQSTVEQSKAPAAAHSRGSHATPSTLSKVATNGAKTPTSTAASPMIDVPSVPM